MRLAIANFTLCPTLVVCALFQLVGCKPSHALLRDSAGYILGPTSQIQILGDTQKKELSTKHLAAAVLLTTIVDKTTRKYCSGTLIGPQAGKTNDRIVTNHHCFSVEEAADLIKQDAVPTDDLCAKTKVFFGFIKGTTNTREVRDCAAGTLRFDTDADLAIFEVSQNPTQDRFAPADIFDGDTVEAGRKASVIHFPTITNGDTADMVYEPEAGYYLPVAQVTLNNCATLGSFPPDEWYLDTTLKMGIKHSCDQTKGSSGSALWDEASDTMLGVDWGGITLNFTNPTRTEVVNVATEASYLRAFVDGNAQYITDFDQKAAEAVANAQQQGDTSSSSSSSIEKTTKKLSLKKCSSLEGAMPLANTLLLWGLLGLPLCCGATGALWRKRKR